MKILKLVLIMFFCGVLYFSQKENGLLAVICFLLYRYTFTFFPVFWKRWICWVLIVVVPLAAPILPHASYEFAHYAMLFVAIFVFVFLAGQAFHWIGILFATLYRAYTTPA